jgi:hypothetical protein
MNVSREDAAQAIAALAQAYQSRLEAARGTDLDVTYEYIVSELQAERNPLLIKNRLHMLELVSFDEKQQLIREARLDVEAILWG